MTTPPWGARPAIPLALLAAALTACAGPATPATPGTTFVNVRILDGTGAPPRPGALRMVGDTIVALGEVTPAAGDSVIDGHGLVLAPGFIDTHSHHTSSLRSIPDALPVVSQGITTLVGGQDGGHPMPLAAAMDSLRAAPAAVNVAWYAGHGTIRGAVMDTAFRRVATPSEVDAMAVLLRRELDAGALGLSTGLEYDPGIYSDRSEVLQLAKVTAAAGGRYISHIRSEDRWFWDAIDEVVTIGRDAKLPVQVSHVKLGMLPLWGRTDSLFRILDAARASGVDVTADLYPYPYWHSTLTVLFPKRDFTNRTEAEKILREIAKPEGLLIGAYAANPAYRGKTIAQLAVLRREDPASTLMGLIAEAEAWEKAHPESDETSESVVATSMSEDDIAALLRWPHTNISSDGAMNGSHPRGYGAFPRVLARYVRDGKVIPLETAVHRMTGLAAAHMGIARRGTLVPGAFADLVLFDPATVADHATPAEPHRVSTGIAGVWVNGRAVWWNAKTTGAHPGRVLVRAGTPAAQ
ncbi:MAG: amidohydrolase family protein [Gemmatimonadaceae bacterium]|nr:amidohydrolase family protein [Gemmatimonadaceae bacterium]